MRYGSAKIDAVDIGVIAGVAGFEASGDSGLRESVADSAGEGIVKPGGSAGIAILGEGAAIGAFGPVDGVSLMGEGVALGGS